TIGGRYHDKVFGGQVPGPIWKDAMTGALDGHPAPGFTSVVIPDAPKPQPPAPGRDDKPGNGGAGGNGGNGANGGGGNGGREPFPGFSFPTDLIGGNGNGNGGNGGNGGRDR
ncbi:penicillin-binding protein, partial [Streptomyces fradiae]